MKKFIGVLAFLALAAGLGMFTLQSGCSNSSPSAPVTIHCLDIGVVNQGSPNGTISNAYITAQPITVQFADTLSSISVYLNNPASGTIVLGLYTDSAGYPATLLASGSMTEVPNSWNTVNLNAPVSAGSYWLALDNSNNLPINGDAATSTPYYLKAYTYSGSLPNPLSAGTTYASTPGAYVLYASFCH